VSSPTFAVPGQTDAGGELNEAEGVASFGRSDDGVADGEIGDITGEGDLDFSFRGFFFEISPPAGRSPREQAVVDSSLAPSRPRTPDRPDPDRHGDADERIGCRSLAGASTGGRKGSAAAG
jgi:hypothetical protein